MNKLELMKMANEIRKGAVTAVYHAKSGHPGGSLSAADIYTYLFFEEMNVDPADSRRFHCFDTGLRKIPVQRFRPWHHRWSAENHGCRTM